MTKVFIKIGANEYNAAEYTVPIDKVFRAAWQLGEQENTITVAMDKAKNIWRDKIRLARISEFAKLDAEFMQALETGADTSAIVTKKQLLRDAPAHPDIDLATSPEELKAIRPSNLNIE